jgi:hypothetical protein
MKPYSHFVIAAQLENDIHPKSSEEFYWGSVAPDARFAAGVSREQTHLSPEKILGYLDKYPHLESFIQGYLIHCLIDNVNTRALLHTKILLRPFLQRASIQFISTIIEAFYIENMSIPKTISGNTNEMLDELGIHKEHIESEVCLMKSYLERPNFETNIAYVKSGTNPGLKPFVKELESIQSNPLIKPLWFNLADFGKLNEEVVLQVRGVMAFKQICG